MDTVPYTEWCTYERGVAGKIYKAGSCYVALSATSLKVNQIKEDSVLNDASRWCVFIPKKYPTIFYEILSSIAWPMLYASCNQGINFKFEHIKFLEFPKVDQSCLEEIEQSLVDCNKAIVQVEREIEETKNMKSFFLQKMFV